MLSLTPTRLKPLPWRPLLHILAWPFAALWELSARGVLWLHMNGTYDPDNDPPEPLIGRSGLAMMGLFWVTFCMLVFLIMVTMG